MSSRRSIRLAVPAKPEPGFDADALRHALVAAGDVAYVWDLNGDNLEWDGASADFARLGGADTFADGASLAARIHPADRSRRATRLKAHIASGRPYDCEYRIELPEGGALWVHDRGAVREGTRLCGVWRFLAAERAAAGAGAEDALTGLYNRPRLRDALDYAVTASRRTARPGAYLVVGVDKLGNVNDSFGEAVGDAVLIDIGRRLELTLRASDVLGRVGADRFGIVLAECPEDHVAIAAERILAAVNREPVRTAAGPVYATVSLGAATFPEQGKVAQEIMNRAEHALTEAKRAGRDCYTAYALSEEQRLKHRADMAMGEQVQRALREGRLVFAYQPVVAADAADRVDYYECLLRMIGEDGKPVAAAAFIPVIERLGFVRIIDRYVLDRAVREASEHADIVLGFNISGVTATDRSWLRAATHLLRDKPDVARRLVVEITETAALSDIAECARFVEALRALGCRVAIDDFGVGFTSLRHLQMLAADTVKIDGMFVRDLADKPENQVFLRHLVGLAHSLGFNTVAEGVESEREAEILRREGVRLLQGYYFARPTTDAPWGK
ncbi:MAG TPA: GGDEF and EAL domain-containing protein [Stellaceae bacterium]|nr:GGDEF and EAL domain-containing protein [Stellaceae bacterium]